MPSTFSIDTEQRVILAEASGLLTIDDLISAQRRMQEDPDYDNAFRFLLDLRDVTEVQISSEELRLLADKSSFDSTAKRAYVVPSELVFGMARVYSAFTTADPGALQIFRDMDEARSWLGIR